jgi:chromosome segregation ATPase
MKTKIVLWGTTEKDEKVLVAIELVEAENLVRTYVIPENEATEVFYNRMLNEWRFDTEIEFPEGTQSFDKQLTLTEDILPDGLKVDRQDLIIRAKTEWHFVVLSKKLYDLYDAELEDFKEKIDKLSEFDNGLWEELKGFWSKVQTQIHDKNLFRKHVDNLRKKTDDAFRDMKDLKKQAEKELREESKKHYSKFSEIMDKMEEKIEGGLGLQPLFEELKDVQDKFKKTNFSREHRRQLWERIDKSFKNIKKKRYGSSSEDRSPIARLQRRYDGLLGAIEKMERSISRDKREMNQQGDHANSSLGQLELEIRKVKMSMVEERIQSKEEKLKDMMKTKSMLEGRLESEKVKEEKRKQFEEAKKEAQEKIQQEIQEQSEKIDVDESELKKAAEKIKEEKAEEKKGFFEKVGDKIKDAVEEMEEIAEDIVDSTKATAKVLGDKLEDKMEDMEEKAEELKEKLEEKLEKAGEKLEKVEDSLEEKGEKLKDKIDEKTGGLATKIEQKADELEDKLEETARNIKSRITGKEEEE